MVEFAELQNTLLCNDAKSRLRSSSFWITWFTTLLFVLALLFVVFVAGIIVLLLIGKATTAAITGGGTLAEGGAVAFVGNQWKRMQTEARAARRDVGRYCPTEEKEKAEETVTNLRVPM